MLELKLLFTQLFLLYFLYYDESLNNCKSLIGRTFFIIHHIITVFILFGGILFGYYFLNLLFIIITALFWIIINYCPISDIHNHYCNIKNKTFKNIGYYSREFIGKLINKKIDYKYELILLLYIVIYDIYMLYIR